MEALLSRRPDIQYLWEKAPEIVAEYASDQYNPHRNAGGYLTMCTSNNRLMLKELDEKFR